MIIPNIWEKKHVPNHQPEKPLLLATSELCEKHVFQPMLTGDIQDLILSDFQLLLVLSTCQQLYLTYPLAMSK